MPCAKSTKTRPLRMANAFFAHSASKSGQAALQFEALNASDLPKERVRQTVALQIADMKEWFERFDLVLDKAMLDSVLSGRQGSPS